jgi:uncharacterized protein (DUF2225 family)
MEENNMKASFRIGSTVAIVLMLVLSLPPNCLGETYGNIKLKCPVDRHEFSVEAVVSMTSDGQYFDFQQKGAIGRHYEHLVYSCPVCHFSGAREDFKKQLDASTKKRVLEELTPLQKGKKLDDVTECEYAAKIYQWQNRKKEEIGNIYLIASYLLRDAEESQQEQRRQMQRLARQYFVAALEEKEISAKERGVVSYLIGELYRRTGEFEEATKWYDKALSERENPVKDIVVIQKELATKRDANNKI